MLNLLTDKHGIVITEGVLFTFDFLKDLDNTIQLTGSLSFNDEDLAYEIDILDNDEFVCLTYATTHILISNIEVIQ